MKDLRKLVKLIDRRAEVFESTTKNEYRIYVYDKTKRNELKKKLNISKRFVIVVIKKPDIKINDLWCIIIVNKLPANEYKNKKKSNAINVIKTQL